MCHLTRKDEMMDYLNSEGSSYNNKTYEENPAAEYEYGELYKPNFRPEHL